VFGEGDVDAKIFFIGEGPGENEDLTGRPFVGRAGDNSAKCSSPWALAREKFSSPTSLSVAQHKIASPRPMKSQPARRICSGNSKSSPQSHRHI
jgi:uracil-DNA glycosylase